MITLQKKELLNGLTVAPLPLPPQSSVPASLASPDPCNQYLLNNVRRNLYVNEAIGFNQLHIQLYKTTGNTYPYPYTVPVPRYVITNPKKFTSALYNTNPNFNWSSYLDN